MVESNVISTETLPERRNLYNDNMNIRKHYLNMRYINILFSYTVDYIIKVTSFLVKDVGEI